MTSPISDQDIYFFREGSHQRLWEVLGAHLTPEGCHFAVWAPNARDVSVVGDWNNWDGRVNPMQPRGDSGVWELFVAGVKENAHYKFELHDQHGHLHVKSDPMAVYGQHDSATASLTFDLKRYQWSDGEWMQRRPQNDLYHSPMSIYEVHPGSLKRNMNDGGRGLTYRAVADERSSYVERLGFTRDELTGSDERSPCGQEG